MKWSNFKRKIREGVWEPENSPAASVAFGVIAICDTNRSHSCVLNGQLVYFLGNNGVGFDLAHASMLFRPFLRVHGIGEFEGHGICLATVERSVTRHGGRIRAEGEVGKGAKFFFTLSDWELGGQVEV